MSQHCHCCVYVTMLLDMFVWQHCQFHISVSQHCHCIHNQTNNATVLTSHIATVFTFQHCHCVHTPTLPLCSQPNRHCHFIHIPTLPLCSHPNIATVFTAKQTLPLYSYTNIATVFTPPHCHLCSHPDFVISVHNHVQTLPQVFTSQPP